MTLEFTWFGHATLGLRTGGFNILVDPYFTDNPSVKVKASDVSADYILVTHGHGDHLGDTVEIAKRCDATVISNAEISGWLRKKGIKVHGQHLGGGFQHPFGYLKLTLALHGSGLPDGSYGGNPAGLLGGGRDRPGGDPHWRQLHHGTKGRTESGENALPKGGRTDPLQHVRIDQTGCYCLGISGKGRDTGYPAGVAARRKLYARIDRQRYLTCQKKKTNQ